MTQGIDCQSLHVCYDKRTARDGSQAAGKRLNLVTDNVIFAADDIDEPACLVDHDRVVAELSGGEGRSRNRCQVTGHRVDPETQQIFGISYISELRLLCQGMPARDYARKQSYPYKYFVHEIISW